MSIYKPASLADQVFEKLENDIIHGVYARGDVLTELKLVEALGVSRTPIREALRRLEQERLIEDGVKGSIVLGITMDDLFDIMNIRESVESLASYYAAKNITNEGIQELKHIVDLQEYYFNKDDLDHMRQMDDAFHDVICRLSCRNVIADTLQPLHRKTQRYRRIAMEDRDRAAITKQEHYSIYQAIAAGDPDLAAKRAAQHIRNARKHMFGG